MMKRILASLSIPLLLVVLLIPVYSEAAYRIILQNGSSIDGVRSYSESGNDINLYFETGSMTILKKDVLRIEGTEEALPEDDQQEEQPAQDAQQMQEKGSAEPVPAEQAVDSKQAKFKQLNNDLNGINTELKTVQERESSLVKEINERSGKKFYNAIQLRQMEKEVEPLKKELAEVQQRKGQLFQKKLSLENEIRGLQ
jgi:predicted RNase H-like nuclease (RuvC/YqgF family)